MAEPNRRQAAFLLHRQIWRESDLLIDLFTPQSGRCRLFVRQGLNRRSPSAALLQPFQPLQAAWQQSPHVTALPRLTELNSAGQPLPLSPPLALWSGYYLNELLLRLLPPDQEAILLFHRYQQTLTALTTEPPEWPLRLFERDLLQEIGYSLEGDAYGEAIRADAHYSFASGELQRLPNASAAADPLSGRLLQRLLQSQPPESREEAQQLKRLMRQLLQRHLGHQPLKVRQFMTHLTPRFSQPSEPL